jgi:26S proteasome regulatory subunit T1
MSKEEKKEPETKKTTEQLKDDKGKPLSDQDIALIKRYGKGPYSDSIKAVEEDIKSFNSKITALCGIKESDTGLALPAQWNL